MAQISQTIYTSPEPSPADRALIDAMVAREVAKLKEPEAPKASVGRTTLVAVTQYLSATPPGTPGFYLQFSESVDQKLQPLAKDKDPRIRLNAAIVASRIAAKVQNAKLAPVTELLLRDKSEAVVLWGLQSAKFILPQLLINGNVKSAVALGDDVVKAEIAYPSAPAIEEAYRAVLLNTGAVGGGQGIDSVKLVDSKSLQAFLPVVIALFDSRVKAYDAETPPQPTADISCAKFFVHQTVWQAATKPQQDQMKLLMLGLLRGAAKQNATVKSKELIEVIDQAGFAFKVLGNALPGVGAKKNPLSEVGDGIGKLKLDNDEAEIKLAIDRLEDVLNGRPPRAAN